MKKLFRTHKIRRIEILENRFGLWQITLYFNKGPKKLLDQSWDTHESACLRASGLSAKQPWEAASK